MRHSPVRRIGLGFGLALIPVVGFFWASLSSSRRLEETARSAARALRAVNAANRLHEQVERTSGQLGVYLATGDPQALGDRPSEAVAIARTVAALRDLDSEDRALGHRLGSLAAVLDDWARLQERFIARRRERVLTESELLEWHGDAGRILWKVHRALDDEIESEERARLGGSIAQARGFASSAFVYGWFGGLAGVVIVIAAALITARDARARWVAERSMEHQALHDALTGLPNRSQLHRRLELLLDAARANGGPFALLLIDLDRFKQINDTLGHHYGDVVLRQMTPRLRVALRESDLAARLGGDEFAILLTRADRTAALAVAERILREVGVSIEVDGHELQVGASIGIALFPDNGRDFDSLMRQADLAMYAAKKSRSGLAVHVADETTCLVAQDGTLSLQPS